MSALRNNASIYAYPASSHGSLAPGGTSSLGKMNKTSTNKISWSDPLVGEKRAGSGKESTHPQGTPQGINDSIFCPPALNQPTSCALRPSRHPLFANLCAEPLSPMMVGMSRNSMSLCTMRGKWTCRKQLVMNVEEPAVRYARIEPRLGCNVRCNQAAATRLVGKNEQRDRSNQVMRTLSRL